MPKIIVEGNIGSGKSTLTKRLCQDLKAIPVLEGVLEDGDVEGCPWLKDYYKEKPGSAFSTQVWFVWNRFKKYMEMCHPGELFIGDRSLWGDLAFAKTQLKMGKMDQVEFDTYKGLWQTMTSLLSPPDAIIYLEASPEFVYNKINDRGRDIEKSIELSYLESLNEHYRSTIDLLTNVTAIFYVDRTRIDGPDGKVNVDSHEYKNLLHMCRVIFRQYEPQPSQWPAPIAKRKTIDETYKEFIHDLVPYISAAARA